VTASLVSYVPDPYVQENHARFVLHHSPAEDAAVIQWVSEIMTQGLAFSFETLRFRPCRALHLCVFHSNTDACEQLRRAISPTMAMAPYADADVGLLMIHSPITDPLNADRTRMLRVLVHEIVHQLVAERSGSTKILGDGNRNMRVSTWITEGIAEYVGILATGELSRLEAMQGQFSTAREYFTFRTLSNCLDGLDHPARKSAFNHVVGAVRLLCEHFKPETVFRDLIHFDQTFALDDDCTPETIRCACA